MALEIGRAWGVGATAAVGDERRNAGVVVLLVPKGADRPGRIFIATGRGVEGIVTDAGAGRIRDLMRPQLSAGEYGPGLRTGVDALASLIARGFGVTDTTLTGGDRAIYRGERAPKIPPLLIFAIIVIAVIVISNISSRGGGPPGHRSQARPPPRVGYLLRRPGLGRRIRRFRRRLRRDVRWWRRWRRLRRIRRRWRLQRRRRRRRLLA